MVMVWGQNLERGLLERFTSVLRNDDKLYDINYTLNIFEKTIGCLWSKKDGKEFAMKELMSTSRQASKAAEKEANMLLFLGIYQNGSPEYHFEFCLYAEVLRLLKFKLPYLFIQTYKYSVASTHKWWNK